MNHKFFSEKQSRTLEEILHLICSFETSFSLFSESKPAGIWDLLRYKFCSIILASEDILPHHHHSSSIRIKLFLKRVFSIFTGLLTLLWCLIIYRRLKTLCLYSTLSISIIPTNVKSSSLNIVDGPTSYHKREISLDTIRLFGLLYKTFALKLWTTLHSDFSYMVNKVISIKGYYSSSLKSELNLGLNAEINEILRIYFGLNLLTYIFPSLNEAHVIPSLQSKILAFSRLGSIFKITEYQHSYIGSSHPFHCYPSFLDRIYTCAPDTLVVNTSYDYFHYPVRFVRFAQNYSTFNDLIKHSYALPSTFVFDVIIGTSSRYYVYLNSAIRHFINLGLSVALKPHPNENLSTLKNQIFDDIPILSNTLSFDTSMTMCNSYMPLCPFSTSGLDALRLNKKLILPLLDGRILTNMYDSYEHETVHLTSSQ